MSRGASATDRSRRGVVRGVLTVLVLGTALVAQRDATPPSAGGAPLPSDPYVGDDAAALATAGYVHVGPMTWADKHDTRRIEEDLGRIPYRWIETAHFKIGCALAACPMPKEKADRAKLREELKQLATKIPNLRPSAVRELDPWLRAHLFAMRAEATYARIQAVLGVDDTAFPPPNAPRYPKDAPAGEPWMGRGPYLGVNGKFLLLLCDKASSCSRYLSTFTGGGHDMPSRWYFAETDAFLFATAPDFADGAYRDDRALHAQVVFNLTHNLVDAYKGYDYVLPSWWKEGLAHVLRREISAEHNNFSAIVDTGRRAYQTFDWDEKVRQRAAHGLVRPLRELLDVRDCQGFDLIDHAACWSRVAWLIEPERRPQFADFVAQQKGRIDALGRPLGDAEFAAAQRAAVESAFGCDVDELDRRWLAARAR